MASHLGVEVLVIFPSEIRRGTLDCEYPCVCGAMVTHTLGAMTDVRAARLEKAKSGP